jgi:hypothetical protein
VVLELVLELELVLVLVLVLELVGVRVQKVVLEQKEEERVYDEEKDGGHILPILVSLRHSVPTILYSFSKKAVQRRLW